MDLDNIEALNEVQASVYRSALKLQSIQRLTHLHVVLVRHVTTALRSVGGSRDISRQEVVQLLNRMFVDVSQEMPGHVTLEAPEEMSSAIFTLFDKGGSVDVDSLQTFLVALCADSLTEKFLALVSLAASGTSPIPGSVNRSSLRTLLHNLRMIPKLVQEETVFGSVEVAVKGCFKSVLSPSVSRDHVISWLHSEPRLLLWLTTMYRLSVSQNVSHNVRCHCCKSRPFSGLRFRCEKCVNVQLCQTCFFTNRRTRKHKQHHPMIEFCAQPTFKESVSSLVQNARHALRFKQSRSRRQMLMESPQTTQSPREDSLDISQDAPVSPSTQTDESATPERSDSAQQTDWDIDQSEREALKDELRTLQQDKCVLEEQLEALRQTVQSEHSVLEDKCSQVEVTVETLRRHHSMLESFVTQALEKIESQRNTETTEDELEDEEEENEETEEEEELKLLRGDEDDVTPPPTVLCGSPLSHNLFVVEEGPGQCSSPPPVQEEQEQQQEEEEEEAEGAEDCGSCSSCPDELLLDAVQRLKLTLERDTWARTDQSTDNNWEELLQAADEVGEEIHQLVESLV
ncbi:dystrotelin [Eucyclogobius newberryi]|uniref:dystrotelin n=1 Tax=Eucyclogobius newberryi TaxID=166745 RepID=UPI003B5A00F5